MRMEGVITVNAISGICRAKTSWCYSRPGQWSVPVGETAVLYGPRAFCLRCAAAFCAESFPGYLQLAGRMPPPGSPAADFPPPALHRGFGLRSLCVPARSDRGESFPGDPSRLRNLIYPHDAVLAQQFNNQTMTFQRQHSSLLKYIIRLPFPCAER